MIKFKKKYILVAFILLNTLAISHKATAYYCDVCMNKSAGKMNSDIASGATPMPGDVAPSIGLTVSEIGMVVAADVAINASIWSNHYIWLNAWSASTETIVSSIAQSTKAMNELKNHQIEKATETVKQVQSVIEKNNEDREFSTVLSQPASGDLKVDQTIALKEGVSKNHEFLVKQMVQVHKTNDSIEAIDKGLSSRYIINLAKLPASDFSSNGIINATYIKSQDEQDSSVRYVQLSTNPIPLRNANYMDKGKNSMKVNKYEIERRLWNGKIEIIQRIMNENVINKIGMIEPD
ncbi:MAG: hypothetical protein KZQ64_04695 [gamma proteobacterium symbiont of Bathyaustriella thionipta]|nr:hypothetical protein [gamma proteobacterium symbiont of Bathyaustriella thionipta]MCU7952678.1 hypothetical protein [gamma proteobacterium symbiont of Bathyaustriella thionipta]MCU7957368.1 hypothetical protein [gamma proteobacterium symbiont of Bathyaustriella thionipta]MCU7967266.1 hypothetical protein [gamma proteobacterium symbiont of Bathyaustriella thionipta]